MPTAVRRHRWEAAAGALGYVAIRVWQGSASPVRIYYDSRSYLAVSRASLWSLRFWAASRPPGTPLLLKVVGQSPERYADVQTFISAGSWLVLAWIVAQLVPRGWRRWVAAIVVLAFSLVSPIAQWDRALLAESATLAFLALLVACLLVLAQHWTRPRALALIAASAAWIATRDTDAYVVVLGAAVLLVGVLVVAIRTRRVPNAGAVAPSVLLLVLAGAALAGAAHGGRTAGPVHDVIGIRIVTEPDRLAWFADHGMPQAGAVQRYVARHRDQPRWDDPAFARLSRWAGSSAARATYLQWLLTHPGYVITEPFVHPRCPACPKSAFISPRLHRYQPDNFRSIPLLSTILFPPWPWWFAALVVVGGLGWRWELYRRRVWWVALALVVLAAPHALIAWHGDGIEMARHGLIATVQFKLGVLLMGLLLLGGDTRRTPRAGRTLPTTRGPCGVRPSPAP